MNYKIKYGDWWIYPTDDPYRKGYDYVHDEYDGAPDAEDKRHGFGTNIESCICCIDDYEAYEMDEPGSSRTLEDQIDLANDLKDGL